MILTQSLAMAAPWLRTAPALLVLASLCCVSLSHGRIIPGLEIVSREVRELNSSFNGVTLSKCTSPMSRLVHLLIACLSSPFIYFIFISILSSCLCSLGFRLRWYQNPFGFGVATSGLKTRSLVSDAQNSSPGIGRIVSRIGDADSDWQSEDHSISTLQGTPHVFLLKLSSMSINISHYQISLCSRLSCSLLPPCFTRTTLIYALIFKVWLSASCLLWKKAYICPVALSTSVPATWTYFPTLNHLFPLFMTTLLWYYAAVLVRSSPFYFSQICVRDTIFHFLKRISP